MNGAHARMVHMHKWCTRTNGAHARMVHTHEWCTCTNGAHARMVHMHEWCTRPNGAHARSAAMFADDAFVSSLCSGGAHCRWPPRSAFASLPPSLPPSHPPSPLLPCSVFACKAKLFNMLGVEWPFDRHDWTVDRCGKEVDYTIDYYSMGDV